jgi:hypothetical protein
MAKRLIWQTHDLDDQKFADQIKGLACYVEYEVNTSVRYHGNVQFPTTASTALPFMRAQPDGTKFAVFTLQVRFGYDGHWTYAVKQSWANCVY